jgi:hypothetical protein
VAHAASEFVLVVVPAVGIAAAAAVLAPAGPGFAMDARRAVLVFLEDRQIIDAGNGFGVARYLQTARPRGGDGSVTLREAAVLIIKGGLVARVSVYPQSEIDEARADAERLARERALAPSADLDLGCARPMRTGNRTPVARQ